MRARKERSLTRRRGLGLLLVVALVGSCGRRGRLRLPEDKSSSQPETERQETEPYR